MRLEIVMKYSGSNGIKGANTLYLNMSFNILTRHETEQAHTAYKFNVIN